MSYNWIKKAGNFINKKNGFFTFLRAQCSSQISSQFDFLVTIICANFFGIFYGTSTLLGNISGGILNCTINYRWTFKAKGIKVRYVLIKFVIVWMTSIFLNTQGTILFTESIMMWVPIDSLPAVVVNNFFLIPKIIVSIIIGVVWNYNMQRLFVYRERNYRKYLAWMKLKPLGAEENKRDSLQ